MPTGRRRESPEPPKWWKIEHYDFLDDLTIEGWTWEFMRRARLKEVFKEVSIDSPVDPMNPRPMLEGPDSETKLEVLDELYPDFWNCYKKYDEIEDINLIAFFPPAIFIPGKWPEGFCGVDFINNDYYLSNIKKLDLRIDLNRSDTILKLTFESLLKNLRDAYQKPSRVAFRDKEWVKNRTIQIWDLKQYGLKWKQITDLTLGKHVDTDKARKAYRISEKFIDGGDWINLACHIESEQKCIKSRK